MTWSLIKHGENLFYFTLLTGWYIFDSVYAKYLILQVKQFLNKYLKGILRISKIVYNTFYAIK
jgi:hypothetical protein